MKQQLDKEILKDFRLEITMADYNNMVLEQSRPLPCCSTYDVEMGKLQSLLYNFYCALSAYNRKHPTDRVKGEEALLVGLKMALEFLEIRKESI